MPRQFFLRGVRSFVVSSLILSSTLALVTSAEAAITNLQDGTVGQYPAVTQQYFNSQTASLACPSSARCDGVGTYTTPTNSGGQSFKSFVVSRVKGAWSSASTVAAPTSFTGTYFAAHPPTSLATRLASISCVSAGNCWSVGQTQGSNSSIAVAVQEVAGIWKTPIAVAIPDLTSSQTLLDSVACTSAGKCMATGQYNANGGKRRRFSVTESQGVWSSFHTIALPASQDSSGSTVTAMKCFGALNCVAVGNYWTGTGYGSFAASSVAGVFSAAQILVPPATTTDFSLDTLWCADVSNCVAGGRFAHSDPWHSLTITETHGTWSQGVQVDLSTSASKIESLSCTNTVNCSALETIGVGGSTTLANIVETSSAWSAPTMGPSYSGPVATAWLGATAVFASGRLWDDTYARSAASSFSNGSFTSIYQLKMPNDVYLERSAMYLDVTCPTSTTCEVLGGFVNARGRVQMYVETYVNEKLTSEVVLNDILSPSGSEAYYGSISCGAPGDCAAFVVSDSAEILANESNGVWSNVAPPDLGQPAQSVTCVGASWCILVGSDNITAEVSIDTGSGWSTAQKVQSLSSLEAISCWSAGNCQAVGYVINPSDNFYPQYATVPLTNGIWGTAVFPAPDRSTVPWLGEFNSVSCVSSSLCVAAGGFDSLAGGYGAMVTSTYSNGTWSKTVITDSPSNAVGDPNDFLYSIKCVSATYCVTVGDYLLENGNSQVAVSTDHTGGKFSTYPVISPYSATTDPTSEDSYVGGVGCMALGKCLVVGYVYPIASSTIKVPFLAFSGTPPPNAPNYVSAGGQLGQMTVSWHVPDANTGPKPASYTARAGSHSCTTTALSCVISGLTPGRQYAVVVVATSKIGSGPPSPPIEVTDVGPPLAPTIKKVLTSSGSAHVDYVSPTFDGGAPITGYVVTAVAANHPTLSATCAPTVLACNLGFVLNGVRYSYKVSAKNRVGISSASAAISAIAIGTAPTVINPIALSSNHSIAVSWTAISDGGSALMKYTATANGISCVSASATHCSISGLANGTSYSVTVTATNAFGTNQPSHPVFATPSSAHAPSPPGPVTALTATGCKGCIKLSWSAPKVVGSGIAYYWICQIGGSNSCSTVKGVRTAQFAATVNSSYSVTVYARNGEFSSPARVTGSPH